MGLATFVACYTEYDTCFFLGCSRYEFVYSLYRTQTGVLCCRNRDLVDLSCLRCHGNVRSTRGNCRLTQNTAKLKHTCFIIQQNFVDSSTVNSNYPLTRGDFKVPCLITKSNNYTVNSNSQIALG